MNPASENTVRYPRMQSNIYFCDTLTAALSVRVGKEDYFAYTGSIETVTA